MARDLAGSTDKISARTFLAGHAADSDIIIDKRYQFEDGSRTPQSFAVKKSTLFSFIKLVTCNRIYEATTMIVDSFYAHKNPRRYFTDADPLCKSHLQW